MHLLNAFIFLLINNKIINSFISNPTFSGNIIIFEICLKSGGIDEHLPNENIVSIAAENVKISKFFAKYDLLNELTRELAIHAKIDLIKNNTHIIDSPDEITRTNILAGGLLTEWDCDFDATL